MANGAAGPPGLSFWIHVTPRARRAALGGLHGEALRVAVTEPPVDGRANAACVSALARAFGVRRSEVELDPAARGRRKHVRIRGRLRPLEARFSELAESR